MTALVSLPMYAAPPQAASALWGALRPRLAAAGFDDVPETLCEPDDLDAHWLSPRLLLSQTCGRPYATTLGAKVALVGTPHYDVPGCEGPFYRSVFVVRRDEPATRFADLRGRRAAYNDRNSHSGFSQLFAEAAARDGGGRFFGGSVATGAHVRSMAAVASGEADVAAIDCVTYALARRDRPDSVASLRTLGFSPPAPALPFVTSAERGADAVEALRGALAEVLMLPELASALGALRLKGMSQLAPSAYDVCRDRAALADATLLGPG